MKKALLMLVVTWGFAARAEPVVLSLAHAAVIAHPAHLAALQFAKRVEKRTHGQVRTQIFPASQPGSENELLRKVRLGALDMDVTSMNPLTKYEKSVLGRRYAVCFRQPCARSLKMVDAERRQ